MPEIIWDKPIETKSKITWDKTKESKIIWDAPLKTVEKIAWDKLTRGGIDWEGTEGDAFAKMSNFQKVLDIIGRPGYAVKAVMGQVQKENLEAVKDIPEGDRIARMKALLEKRPQIKQRLEAAWRGFTGKERNTANELWENVGVKGVPFLGFATEVATDPLMYGGYSAATKVLDKGIKLTAKGVKAIPGVTKVTTAITEKVQPVTTALKEMFITKTGLGKLNEIIDKHLLEREYLKGKELPYAIKVRNVIQHISKKTGQSIDDVEKQIVNLIEQPEIIPKGAITESKTLANVIKSHLSNILTKEMKAGVPITALSETRKPLALIEKQSQLVKNLLANKKDLVLSEAKIKGISITKEESIRKSAELNEEILKRDEFVKDLFVKAKTAKPFGAESALDDLEKLHYKLANLEMKGLKKERNLLELFAGKKSNEIEKILVSREYQNIIADYPKTISELQSVSDAILGGTRNIAYFPRITTQEAKQYLSQAKIGNAKIWNPKIANALRRKTGDFTLQEFNDFVASHGLKSLGGRSVEQFFMQQPAYAVATRGIRSAKAVTSAQFLDEVGKTFGLSKAPSFWQELPDTVTKLNPSLKGLKFDPEVMSEITRVTTQYIDPQGAKIFMRGFDVIQNLWKKWTLAPFPKYHLRNMVGNAWNNYLAGVNPANYAKAQAIQMYKKYKGTKLGKMVEIELKGFGVTNQMADDIILQAEKTGIMGKGWYAADIEEGLKKEFERGFISQPLRIKAKKIVTGEIVTEKGMAFGSTIENNARLAHFLDRLSKGNDSMQAAVSVKKFLFDYGDLTAFEKQVMKRLMPFYTWTRKNIPLQAETLWKQPEKFAPLAVPLRGRDPRDLLRLKYSKPQLYERLPVELKRDIDTVTYVPLEGLIPAGDLAKMVRPQEIFVELLTPYLRAPIELMMNKSFYFESEIQLYPKETQELLRMDIPVKLKYTLTTVIPQARMLNELNKLVKKQVRKEELTPPEQAFAQSLSSIYKVNLKDLRDRALRNVEKKIEDLKRGKFWAKRYERTKEGERIRKTYEELKDLMKKIKE